jgi:predicted  nucleic acid-binding Zn-ribbon protein
MSDLNLQRANLLTLRLSAVSEAAALNAEALRLTQKLAGIEMELLRIELELDRHPGDCELAEAMEATRDQLAAIEQKQNECADLYSQREQEIAEIDRQLAAAMAGLAGGGA